MNESIGLGIDIGSVSCRFALVQDGRPIPLSVPRQFDEAEMESAAAGYNSRQGDPFNQSLAWKQMLGSEDPRYLSGPFGPRFVRRLLERGIHAAQTQTAAKIRRTVLSVPSHYFMRQRQTLRACATAAGIADPYLVGDAVTLVAAFADMHPEGHALIYQCGYLGFEVAIVSFLSGRIHVLSTGGGEAISGQRIDRLLLDHLTSRTTLGPEVEKLTLAFPGFICQTSTRLREELARFPEVVVNIDVPGRRIPETLICRTQWHKDLYKLVESTLVEVDAVIDRARMRAADLTHVLLAGGCTAQPAFAEVLRVHLGRTPVRLHDWSSAFGAAILASRLGGSDLSNSELALDVSDNACQDTAALGVVSSVQPAGSGQARGALNIVIRQPLGPQPGAAPPVAEPPTASLACTLAKRSLARAEELLRQGKHNEAVSMSHNAYEDNREDADVLTAMLDIHCRAAESLNTPEDYEKALECLLCANRHDPANIAVRHALANRHLLHARQMFTNGRHNEALTAAERAFQIQPETPETESLLSTIRQSLEHGVPTSSGKIDKESGHA